MTIINSSIRVNQLKLINLLIWIYLLPAKLICFLCIDDSWDDEDGGENTNKNNSQGDVASVVNTENNNNYNVGITNYGLFWYYCLMLLTIGLPPEKSLFQLPTPIRK